MGIFSGFIKFAGTVLKFVGYETIKGAFFEGFFDELIFEPTKELIIKKWEKHKTYNCAFNNLKKAIDQVGIDNVADKLKIIDDGLRNGRKSFFRKKEYSAKETAKKVLIAYESELKLKNAKEIVGDIVTKNHISWDYNGAGEQIVTSILDVYLQSLPELMYSHLPEEYRWTIKIIQSEFESIKEDVNETIQNSIMENMQILLQQHAPIATLTQPIEIKSPFAFIKRKCPTCGYDGEYLYYNKEDQTVFCSACGTFYDVEKDSGKYEEIEKLIKSTEIKILNKMKVNAEKNDTRFDELLSKLETTSTVNEENTADVKEDLHNLQTVVNQSARDIVLQSQTLKDLVNNEKNVEVAITRLGEEIDSFDLKLGDIQKGMGEGFTDVKNSVKTLNNIIDIRRDQIVDELKQQADELKKGQRELKEGQRELKEGQRELKEGQRELKDGRKELKGEHEEILKSVNEIRNEIRTQNGLLDSKDLLTKLNPLFDKIDRISQPAPKKGVSSPRNTVKYLCPVCFAPVNRNDNHCPNCETKFEVNVKLNISEGNFCENVFNRVRVATDEKVQNVISENDKKVVNANQKIVRINIAPNDPFNKMKWTLSPEIKIIIIDSVNQVPLNTSEGPCAFDKLDKIIVLSKKTTADKLQRNHFVTSSGTGKIFVVTESRVLELKTTGNRKRGEKDAK